MGTSRKSLFRKFQSSCELFVEISAEIVRPFEEHLQHKKRNALIHLRVLRCIEFLSERFQEVVPLRDKGLVSLQIRYFKPAVNADLALSGHIAAVFRHEVAKAGPVVFAAEREKTAEAGAERSSPSSQTRKTTIDLIKL